MVVYISLSPLYDLCGYRLAYLLWTRHDVTKVFTKEILLGDLENIVLANVQSLPLPEKIKSRIFNDVKLVGKHLFSFLSVWLPKTQIENERWLTGEMLFECLILNADGLINPRKTAEKILRNKILPSVIAFRLACVNFLEEEILKLWPTVMKYFLNKIVQESENPSINSSLKPYSVIKYEMGFPDVEINSLKEDFSDYPFTTEPREVLFWIGCCMSKQTSMDIKEIPHFIGSRGDWYEFALEDAIFYGNVACFDYFRLCQIACNHVKLIEKIFQFIEEDYKYPCFISQFIQLNSEEKAHIFKQFSRKIITYFLEWPLSLTFVENTEEFFNLFLDEFERYWLVLKIFVNLFHRYSCKVFKHEPFPFYVSPYASVPEEMLGTYKIEHLESIWIALWRICPDTFKSCFLDKTFFSKFLDSNHDSEEVDCDFYNVRVELLHCFFSNGEAVLELFKGIDNKESLRAIIAKYMPNDFTCRYKKCMLYIETKVNDFMLESSCSILSNESEYTQLPLLHAVHEKFILFIRDFLFSLDL